MNPVHRETGVQKVIRKVILRRPAQKFTTAGDRNCRQMILTPREREQQLLEEIRIFTSAQVDLNWEIRCGFWEIQAA